jgi:hypothetical protein
VVQTILRADKVNAEMVRNDIYRYQSNSLKQSATSATQEQHTPTSRKMISQTSDKKNSFPFSLLFVLQ